jgi:uncharacterized protein YjdB
MTVLAHPGRTDSRGGHKDNQNKSGLGYYHYHHGYGPHLHTNGICPYNKPKNYPVNTIKIDSSDLVLDIGETETLSVKITPSNASNKSVIWSSSDTSIITVNSKGSITAKKSGTAIITAKTHNGKTHTISVTVKEKIESIKFNHDNIELKIDESKSLEVILTPNRASKQEINWSSNDNNIATVNDLGVVTGQNIGTTQIIVKIDNGISDNMAVSVFKERIISSIQIESGNIDLLVGDTKELNISIEPVDADDKTVTWISSDPNIVTVNGLGVVQAEGVGTAKITAKSSNDKSSSVDITVSKKNSIESDSFNNINQNEESDDNNSNSGSPLVTIGILAGAIIVGVKYKKKHTK